MDLRWMTERDETAVAAAANLFGHETRPLWTQRFLTQPEHHLCIAYVDGVPAGFVSGVELTHPDKGTEMFLYELGVDAPYRNRGLGRGLVDALARLARERGCYGMWVLTDADNVAALKAYRAAGATDRGPSLMLDWQFEETA